MRTSVITRFAKNTRSLSGRRRIAALAATTVLAGGIQFLATDTAWACGDDEGSAPVTAPAKPSAADEQDQSFELHGQGATATFTSIPAAITVGGSKAEFDAAVFNGTGADYHRIIPGISVFNTHGSTPKPSQVTAEIMVNGQWQRLSVRNGCDPAVGGAAPAAAMPLAKGHTVNYRFRVGLSADVTKDVDGLQVIVSPGAGGGRGAVTEVKVAHPQAPAKPTTPAKPEPAPTKKAKEAKEAKQTKHAEPAADQTPAKETPTPAAAAPTSPAPQATSSAPATTAPAGTPELAHTGAAETNTFLAVSAAALLALGAGVLIAVRRLRPQR
ncbi:hypothetical protein ACGF12_00960 [Kitasatospora sp. NPDC048296]|uniref:hypothetical protein n=1 Tax=Kitasatospora sp. NPDC048296 TaxID=3364048 RepID=UPI0037124F28